MIVHCPSHKFLLVLKGMEKYSVPCIKQDPLFFCRIPETP